jgi:hypothetical protein
MICWRCHSNSINAGSSLPSILEVMTSMTSLYPTVTSARSCNKVDHLFWFTILAQHETNDVILYMLFVRLAGAVGRQSTLHKENSGFLLYQRLQCTDNYFFKIKFVLFLYLLLSAPWKENDLSWYIFAIRQTVRYRTPILEFSLCTLTPEVQCLTFHQNHVV